MGTKVVPFLFSRYWNPTRLAESTQIDIRARGDQVTIVGESAPVIDCWLTIRNHAPFDVVLDKLNIDIRSGGYSASIWFHHTVTLSPGQTKDVSVGSQMNPPITANLDQQGNIARCNLVITGYFKCRYRGYEVTNQNTAFINARLINIECQPAA